MVCPEDKGDVTVDVRKLLKECRKVVGLTAVGNLQRIQDQPVVFAPLRNRVGNFNNDYYKPYTISGPKVDYAVWPPLLLHEGGPILARGVAQGCGKEDAS